MASANPFAARKSAGAGGMTGGDASALDAPPPSPSGPQQPLTPGMQPAMPSFAEMSTPFTAGSTGRATTPEVLMGVMSSLETIAGMYDSMASIIPDCASDFAMLKDLQQRVAAKLLVKGGQTATPQAVGSSYPGGGFDRGQGGM